MLSATYLQWRRGGEPSGRTQPPDILVIGTRWYGEDSESRAHGWLRSMVPVRGANIYSHKHGTSISCSRSGRICNPEDTRTYLPMRHRCHLQALADGTVGSGLCSSDVEASLQPGRSLELEAWGRCTSESDPWASPEAFGIWKGVRINRGRLPTGRRRRTHDLLSPLDFIIDGVDDNVYWLLTYRWSLPEVQTVRTGVLPQTLWV